MIYAVLSADFKRQFHQEFISYQGTKKRYQDLLVRQYTGNKQEAIVWGQLLVEKFNDEQIINAFLTKLKKKDMVIADHLLAFIRKLENKIVSCEKKGFYTHNYSSLLSTDLRDCSSLVTSFNRKIQQSLCDKLSCFNNRKVRSGNKMRLSGAELTIVIAGAKRFSFGMHRYFDLFIDFLDQESANSRRNKIKSPIEEPLLELITLIEKMMMASVATRSHLEKWQSALATREIQELYN